MAVASSKTISQSTFVYETEPICSREDKYYLDRLFFGVESHDLTIVKSFTNEHLRHLCRIRRFFDSEWLAPDKEKQTAYQRACLLGYTDIVQHMLEVGVTIAQLFSPTNAANVTRNPFMFACHSGSLATIRVLLQTLSSDPIDHYKARNSPARCSISFARQYLIPRRNEIEALFSSEYGLESVFLIHFAIARNDLELVRLVVTSANGELDTTNDWKALRCGGFTPLHIACLFNRSLTMIKLLLSFGEANANPILQTSEKGIFADQMTTDQEVAEYLRSKRLSIINLQEQQRLTDLEEMQSGRPYQITIKPLSGQTLTLTVNGHTTTYQLAAYLEHECSIPQGGLKLFFNGLAIPSWVEASQPLIHYNIKKDSVLHIIWRNPKHTKVLSIKITRTVLYGICLIYCTKINQTQECKLLARLVGNALGKYYRKNS